MAIGGVGSGGGMAAIAQQMMAKNAVQNKKTTETAPVETPKKVSTPGALKAKAAILRQMKAGNLTTKTVANRKELESKSQIMDRVSSKLADTGIEVKTESRLKSVGRTIAKFFGSLFSGIANTVQLVAKGLVNAGAQTIGRAVNLVIGNGFSKPGWLEGFNKSMDKSMEAVNEFFGDWGAIDAVSSGLDEASGALGHNYVGSTTGQVGETGNQGELSMQLGMATAVKGGIEAIDGFINSIDQALEGKKLVNTGNDQLTVKAAAVQDMIKNLKSDVASQSKKLMTDHGNGKIDNSAFAQGMKDIEGMRKDIQGLQNQLDALTGGGEFLKEVGQAEIKEATAAMVGSVGNMGVTANSVINLLAGSDSYGAAFSSVAGTATQVVGAGVTVVTSLMEARDQHKIQKASEANATNAADFRGKVGAQIKTDEAKVVGAVKQFERNNVQTAKTSKVTKWLKVALAVAAVAVIAATFAVAAITPIGWAIGGAALAIGLGVGAHKAYKSIRNDAKVSGLQTAQNDVRTKQSQLASRQQQISSKISEIDDKLKTAKGDQKVTLQNEKAGLETEFNANVDMLQKLEAANEEITGALIELSPETARDELIRIANKREPNSTKFSSEAKLAQDALADVFKLPKEAFMTEAEVASDGSIKVKPLNQEAFKAGKDLLKRKLDMFSTKATDYDKVVKPDDQSFLFKTRWGIG